MTDIEHDRPSERVLIISDEASAYASHLDALANVAVETAADAIKAWDGEQIILGEPDKVAAALPEMPGVRWIQSTWAGVLPLREAAMSGVTVTGVKGVGDLPKPAAGG